MTTDFSNQDVVERLIQSVVNTHKPISGRRCRCGWEGDLFAIHLIDEIQSVGVSFIEDGTVPPWMNTVWGYGIRRYDDTVKYVFGDYEVPKDILDCAAYIDQTLSACALYALSAPIGKNNV